MRSITYLVIVLAFLAGCNNAKVKKTENKPAAGSTATPDMHAVVAKDVVQTSGYTYLQVKEGDKEYWVAVSRFEAEKGKTYYYNQSMEMSNFKSKELNRTFENILFIQDFSDQPIKPKPLPALTTKGRQNMEQVGGIKVEPISGGIKLSEIFANPSSFNGKKVKVSGQVIKFSPEIMQKNWVHIQDGSEANGSFDLTVTTLDAVEVGKVVSFEGVIAVNKDFGYGYKYDVILEEAKVIK
ncbi:MAG: GW dipeptide domain-containing protein [Prolixibacteraceae bacterium]